MTPPSQEAIERRELPATTSIRRLIGVRHWSVSAKLIVLIAPLLILFLILFAWAFAGRQRMQMLDEQTTVTAEAILMQIRADREYYATTIVPRLSAMQAIVSADYHHTPNAFPLPATFLREVTEMIASSPSSYRVKLISPWPINKKNGIQDSFQEDGFKALLTSRTSLFKRQEHVNGTTVMRFLAPDRAVAQSCVNCHNSHPLSPKQDFKLNDIMGGIEISIPIESALQAARRDQLWLVAGGSGISVLVMLLIVWSSHIVVTQPVRELTAQMQKIASASGDIAEEPAVRRRTEQVMGEEIRQLWHGFWDMYLSFRLHQQERAADLERQAGEMQILNQRLIEMQKITQSMQQAISEDEVYRILCHTLQQSVPLQQILILRLNASEDRLETIWTSPKREDLSIDGYPVWNEPHRCPVIRSGREYTVQDTSRDLICPSSISNRQGGGYWCVPLVIGGRTIGVVHLVSQETNRWTEDTCHWIEALVNVAAPMIGHLQHLERAKRRALIDELTGAYNRRFLEETLAKLVVPDERRRGQVVSLLVIDLDHFKKINDTYGHQVGDLVLKAIAQTLHRTLKESDVLARYGGEEFIVVLPQTDTVGAVAVGERLRTAVAGLSLRKLAPVAPERVTISIGIATYPAHASTVAELIHAADEALYQSKSQGRNRVTCAPDSLEAAYRKADGQNAPR
jgi:diguanylate cyclase (GGDEF)-like protein